MSPMRPTEAKIRLSNKSSERKNFKKSHVKHKHCRSSNKGCCFKDLLEDLFPIVEYSPY